jgi:uncharacterized membrane protein YidH (DUF202 family)
MGKGSELYDRSAQLERTALAWSRASVAVVANGALLLRAGLVYHHAFVIAAGLAASVTGLALWMLSTTQYSALAGRRAGHLLAGRPGAVRLLTFFVAIVSVLALVTTLVR